MTFFLVRFPKGESDVVVRSKFLMLLAAVVLAGCSSMSQVMLGEDGTFSLSATGRSTQNASEVLTDLYQEANKFCNERGMVVEVVNKAVKASRAARDLGVRIGVGGGSRSFSRGFGCGIGLSLPLFEGDAPEVEMVFRCTNYKK